MKNPYKFFCLFFIMLSLLPACQKKKNLDDYKYSIELLNAPEKWYAGECNFYNVKVKNTGKVPWVVSEDNIEWRVRLSYHIYKGDSLVCEGMRTDFARTVRPGESVIEKMNIYVPLEPGDYKVVIDLLKEGKFWFKDIGNQPASLSIHSENPFSENRIIVPESASFEEFLNVSEKMDSRMRMSISYSEVRQTVELAARNYVKNLQNDSSSAVGWIPGSNYPQVWLRDSYYHACAGIFLYEPDIIRRIIENFLDYSSLRRKFVPDFIASDGSTADYSVTPDRFPLLVLLACDYIDQTNNFEWLKKKMGKKTIYEMIDTIVEKLFKDHFDENSGLFFSAHIADWGDVEFEDDGADSQKIDRSSHRIAGIYTQAVFYDAMKKWADILYKTHLYQNSMQIMKKADTLKSRVNEELWNEKSGFFRIHKHLDALNHDFNEDEIFALGGNVWAIRSGLADPEQAEKILEYINKLQVLNGYPTVSKVLNPPYPKDFFANQSLTEPDRYQNGGFWDWYGGMAVLEEFRFWDYDRAIKHLREICSASDQNNGLYEWYDVQKRGQGSMHYLASGSAILEAIIRGYYGVDTEKGIWKICPAYDESKRSIYCSRKESGLLIAFRISPDKRRRIVRVDYKLAGQNAFNFNLPICPMSSEEYNKMKNKYAKNEFFFNPSASFLFYKTILKQGSGGIEILY